MADPKKQDIPDVLTDADFDVPDVLTDADFEDAGGNVMKSAPTAEGGAGVAQMMGNSGFPQGIDPDPESRAHKARMVMQFGVPTVASVLLGPEAGIPAHALMQLALAGPLHIGGEAIDPSKTDEERKSRAVEGLLGPVAGEVGGGLGIAGAHKVGRALYPFAEQQGLRALGFLSDKLSRLGSTGLEALERGQEISRIALDNDILRFFGNSRDTAQRAVNLGNETGGRLGAARDAIDAAVPGVEAQRIWNELVKTLQTWRPGRSAEPAFQGNLDDALVDLMAHSNSSDRLDMRDLADLKDVYGEGARFHSTPESMVTSKGAPIAEQSRAARGVAQGFEEAHAASNMTPDEFDQFMRDKEINGAMQELVGGHGALGRRVIRDQGNSQAGLLPTVIAAGSGTPMGQLATLVGARTVSQYGNQMSAVLADRVAKGLLDPQMAQLILIASQAAGQAEAPSMAQGLGIAP